jgi:hypothetical protein
MRKQLQLQLLEQPIAPQANKKALVAALHA